MHLNEYLTATYAGNSKWGFDALFLLEDCWDHVIPETHGHYAGASRGAPDYQILVVSEAALESKVGGQSVRPDLGIQFVKLRHGSTNKYTVANTTPQEMGIELFFPDALSIRYGRGLFAGTSIPLDDLHQYMYPKKQILSDEDVRANHPRLSTRIQGYLCDNRVDLATFENDVQRVVSYPVESRWKGPGSVLDKMKRLKWKLTDIFDVNAARIICPTPSDCYFTAEKLWGNLIEPVWVRDFIAFPKLNGYQSLHLIGKYSGKPIEIQLRTLKMDEMARRTEVSG